MAANRIKGITVEIGGDTTNLQDLMIHNPDVLFPRTLRQVYYMAKIKNIHDERP